MRVFEFVTSSKRGKTICLFLVLCAFLMSVLGCNNGKRSHQATLGNGFKEGKFVDQRDGQIYSWVEIGNQIWMTENLRFDTDSGAYLYKNRTRSLKKTGYLYSFKALQTAAPEGWHIPTEEEYLELLISLGGYTESTIGHHHPGRAYGRITELEGIFNFRPNAVYYPENGRYLKGVYPFKSVELWTSTYTKLRNDKDSTTSIAFFHDYFRHQTGVTLVSRNAALPVRCVKD